MPWIIVETGVAVIPPNAHPRLVSSFAGNSGVRVYWDTPGIAMVANAGHNVFHFTLGAIVGGTAYFHATWNAAPCVSHFACSVDANGTMAVNTIPHVNNNNTHLVPLAWAVNFAAVAYQAVEVKAEKEKEEKEAFKAKGRKAFGTGPSRLLGNALGVKPTVMKSTKTHGVTTTAK